MSEKSDFINENKIKKYKRQFWLFAVLSALAMGFIFYNSLQIPVASNARSHVVAGLLRRLAIFKNLLDDELFHRLVRKAAHFTEYGMLGFFICGAERSARKIKMQGFVSLCLLISLSTAVLDEFIQGFFGRTSEVRDVIIDFSGAVCGFLLMWGISALIGRRKR